MTSRLEGSSKGSVVYNLWGWSLPLNGTLHCLKDNKLWGLRTEHFMKLLSSQVFFRAGIELWSVSVLFCQMTSEDDSETLEETNAFL